MAEDITCSVCGSEYHMIHIKIPARDKGGSVCCNKCGTSLYSWEKGTDDYDLVPIEEYRKKQEVLHKRIESAPLCPKCGSKMVLKYDKIGWNWSCVKFPECTETLKIRQSDISQT